MRPFASQTASVTSSKPAPPSHPAPLPRFAPGGFGTPKAPARHPLPSGGCLRRYRAPVPAAERDRDPLTNSRVAASHRCTGQVQHPAGRRYFGAGAMSKKASVRLGGLTTSAVPWVANSGGLGAGKWTRPRRNLGTGENHRGAHATIDKRAVVGHRERGSRRHRTGRPRNRTRVDQARQKLWETAPAASIREITKLMSRGWLTRSDSLGPPGAFAFSSGNSGTAAIYRRAPRPAGGEHKRQE